MLEGKWSIAYHFGNLVKKIRRERSGNYFPPRRMKEAVSRKSRRFSGYNQQDAQEFLICLLEGINEELNRVRSKPKYVELDYHNDRSMQKNVSYQPKNHKTKERGSSYSIKSVIRLDEQFLTFFRVMSGTTISCQGRTLGGLTTSVASLSILSSVGRAATSLFLLTTFWICS